MRITRNWSVRSRSLLLGVGPALLMLALLAVYFVHARLSDVQYDQDKSGRLMAVQLAAASEYLVLSGDPAVVEGAVGAVMRQPAVAMIRIYDRTGRLLLMRNNRIDGRAALTRFDANIVQEPLALEAAASVAEPEPPQVIGRVEVWFTDAVARERSQEILLGSGLLGLLALVVSITLALRMTRTIVEPLQQIANTLEHFRGGDFDQRCQVDAGGELGNLVANINNTALALAEARSMQQHYTEDLITARTAADAASQAKSEFLAMMSHELRTPMNGVIGMLQLMEHTELSAEQAEYVKVANESTRHLLVIVNDILDFSRIEQGAFQLIREYFALDNLVASTIESFRAQTDGKGLTLALVMTGDGQHMEVMGDPVRLRQILVNLLGNAVKFTHQGGIDVFVDLSRQDKDKVRFSCTVRDTGIGIRADLIDSMFDPFIQGDASHTRRYGGTGLGLAIVRRLVDQMQGRIEVHSAEGSGSAFTVVLDLSARERSVRLGAERLPVETLGGFHALVVEDNQTNLMVAHGMLRALQCEVEVAVNGREAVEKVHGNDRRFDIIFMDCQMPVMDGYEATRLIRHEPHGQDIPIVALTASAMPGVREACLAAGMDDILTKPFRKQQLLDVLQKWCAPVHQRSVE